MSPRRRPSAAKLASADSHVLAAIDLGSNSFHMVVARRLGEDLQIIDRVREGVRLAAALDEQRRLSEAGMSAALECLERFGQRLRDLPPESVRIVGTNTLRQAKNGQVFLERAQRALGHEIEVVSGHEEARLIYLGAAHSIAIGEDRSLVVDIGGGSTECIVGRGTKAELTESLYMGCVSWSQRFFRDGVLTRERFRAAEIAARLEVQQIRDRITDARWVQCWGTSGTIRTIRELLRIHGWGPDGIDRKGLRELRKAMIAAGRLDQLRLEGLPEDRVAVLPGGLAILWALIKDLEIDRMLFAPGALREGLLYDLIGRLDRDDVRDRTIRRLIDTYDVDVRHARRVAATAGKILAEVARSWRLGPRHAAWLERAAMLHEIGLALSHSGFHKHGAYIVRNSHLAGYSLREQRILATLILAHRRKWPKAAFAELAPTDETIVTRLALVLRLAVLLERTRTRDEIPTPGIRVRKDRVVLAMPKGWLDDHPLTRADLAAETEFLAAGGWALEVH
jgi:exopolyphosphatase/guanosine-5'-triphosphate,3'-diphosphate pyrophosphatase